MVKDERRRRTGIEFAWLGYRARPVLRTGRLTDAGAYKLWLVDIAESVVGAATTGGVFGFGGADVTEAERRFRDQLSHLLSD